MTPEPERFYSVDEANAAIGRLRESLATIRRARLTVLRSATRIHQRAPADGGGAEAPAYWDALRTLREGVEELAAQGLVLRDADTGLIDFPSRREGRPVYLCWRTDEDRVGHWHEVSGGFAGRKPL